MTSIQRPLSADVLKFSLADEAAGIAGQLSGGRASRTLIKNGPLRVTIITLASGGAIKEHHADGPITVQVLRGQLDFITSDKSHALREGDLLSLGGGVRHSVASETGATFLLTIAAQTTTQEG